MILQLMSLNIDIKNIIQVLGVSLRIYECEISIYGLTYVCSALE